MASNPKYPQSLCWDCANACCGCTWSRSFKPIDGWVATPTMLKVRVNNDGVSYVVHECPQFKRDSFGFGLKWADPLRVERATV